MRAGLSLGWQTSESINIQKGFTEENRVGQILSAMIRGERRKSYLGQEVSNKRREGTVRFPIGNKVEVAQNIDHLISHLI